MKRAGSYDKSDLRDHSLMPKDPTDEQRARAQRTTARHALDADDLRELLEALGLYPTTPSEPRCRPLTPSARAKAFKRAHAATQAQETP